MKDFSAFLGVRIGLMKSAPENICLKTCPASSSPEHRCLVSALHPELLSGGVEGQQLHCDLIPVGVDDKC